MICCLRSTPHLAILFLVGACAHALPAQDPTRFEADIRAFEAADRASPPPLGGVLFVGSSSIKNWTDVAADFPGVPVLNRGFGGSTLADVVYYADRIVLPYHPRLVVLYAGDNDLEEGRTPEQVVGDYRAFVARLRSALPAARLAYVSIKPSPARRMYTDRMRETNRRIRAEIARDSLQAYVDVLTPMLDAAGQPRPELFEADSLHMTRAGYLLWRALLAPVVRSRWALLACRSATTPREGHLAGGGGVRIFYRVVGDGLDTIVAIHGGPGGDMGVPQDGLRVEADLSQLEGRD